MSDARSKGAKETVVFKAEVPSSLAEKFRKKAAQEERSASAQLRYLIRRFALGEDE